MKTEKLPKVEKYRGRISLEFRIFLIFILAMVLTLLVRWILHPDPQLPPVIALFTAAFLSFLVLAKRITSVTIVLTQDAFIQKGLERVVQWEDIDRIVLYLGKYRKPLYIYYREDQQIKRLSTLYASVEKNEQLLASLKKFSRKYGFAFEEKHR